MFHPDKYRSSTSDWRNEYWNRNQSEKSEKNENRTNLRRESIDAKNSDLSKEEIECNFCKNNQEPECVYRSHMLKSSDGRVVCGYLRRYKCPVCCASGDNAHTKKYCPVRAERSSL